MSDDDFIINVEKEIKEYEKDLRREGRTREENRIRKRLKTLHVFTDAFIDDVILSKEKLNNKIGYLQKEN